MRVKRLLAAWLCASLAVPSGAFAQRPAGAPAASGAAPVLAPGDASLLPGQPALVSGPLDDDTDIPLPGSIAPGVFGTYGGAQSRFSGQPGSRANDSLRALSWVPQLPDLGDGSGGSLTPQAERRIGERVMREIRTDPDYVGDWLVRDYLNSVAAKLSAAASAQFVGGYRPDFDLFAMRDGQINAFSLPGGFIGVNTGLIVATQTESELASVLAHEMGHVLQRHIARMLAQNDRNGYTALAGMLLGVLAGVLARSGDLGSAIAIGGQAYAVDSQLRFSRAAEHEADRVGFQLLNGAGYDPYGMVAFFERLDRASMGDAGVPAYARTHPLTVERIADMEDRARRTSYRQPRQAPEYAFVRARVRVLQDRSRTDHLDQIARLRSEIEDRTAVNVAANWYGIAFAQMLIERYDDAAASLANARQAFVAFESEEGASVRSSPSLDVLAADIARRAGRNDDAVQLATAARRAWPDSHAATDALLQSLLGARKFAQAQALALHETQAEPSQPAWWQYLAQASVGVGDGLAQRRALAEKFALDGAWPSAIRQLKEARDMKTVGYYDLSKIDARLHEFETRYKEEREDEKDRG
ncbi:M48 family metalloprotease [Paraburkholderia caballeronis]|uniref:Putative Zn-dependent protease, contains TPR repeats n=1 Tax=Paraburkholderia caballeronis TaxID=416943 RepID=A0A1H7PT94_9BURK|nr:M48 family metalloprotease [Paraburkholderia caballeronis]PXW24327.1 putative Zn-dependent protease [Paraburkholderia caballeronis]PXX00109.1 putative Zn-dependent protease [Paraburkholderia caballeronis]RAJ97238.1 putative Zn-dependent protease [Paraburkholderia caballeronis]SEB68007.1 Putative Zn-dependent protease, contains TPR repeats [Paraburkholderia caballeronis]SEL38796.1 Putative Zn-dependent protease, contains TPR repeats [Paraburkholderia caballeronis]